MIDLPELPFIDTMMTTFVFYGIDRKPPVREAKAFIEDMCSLLGETPSHADVGMNEGKRSRRPKFGMVDKAIAKGDFDNYTYIIGENHFTKGNVRDCCLAVGVVGTLADCRVEIHFRTKREKPVRAGALLSAVLDFSTPQYGIRYDMTVREGPRWFVAGQWSSGMPVALGRASSQFAHEYLFGKKFRDGYFRDLFSWNYLNQAHLDREIEGLRFEDWVNEPSNNGSSLGKPKTRGTLTPVASGGAVWELTEAEAREVRPRMLRAGLLMVKE